MLVVADHYEEPGHWALDLVSLIKVKISMGTADCPHSATGDGAYSFVEVLDSVLWCCE